jgi:hypothetical protein
MQSVTSFASIGVHSWFLKVWPGAGGRSPAAGEALVRTRKAAFEMRSRAGRAAPGRCEWESNPLSFPFGSVPSAIFSRVLDPANAQDRVCDAGRLLVWSKV